MRIRRNASKILGSATVCAAPWPSPPTPQANPCDAFADCAGILCELNRSPWDVMPKPMAMDPDHSYCYNMIFTNPKDGGILRNKSKKIKGEEPIISAAVPSTAYELAISGTKIKGKEKRKIREEITTPASSAETISSCRKSDGKGWRCKRLAQLPSSFCSYHLAQIRSYSSNHRHRAAVAYTSAADDRKINHLAKLITIEEKRGDSNLNLYNFYFGFGPWRGKRRGKATVIAKVVEEVKEDMAGKESMNHDDDGNVVAGDIAGGDEYDLDDDDNFYSIPLDNDESGKKEVEMEKRRVVKKRGRKPIKARSLKSLL